MTINLKAAIQEWADTHTSVTDGLIPESVFKSIVKQRLSNYLRHLKQHTFLQCMRPTEADAQELYEALQEVIQKGITYSHIRAWWNLEGQLKFQAYTEYRAQQKLLLTQGYKLKVTLKDPTTKTGEKTVFVKIHENHVEFTLESFSDATVFPVPSLHFNLETIDLSRYLKLLPPDSKICAVVAKKL